MTGERQIERYVLFFMIGFIVTSLARVGYTEVAVGIISHITPRD